MNHERTVVDPSPTTASNRSQGYPFPAGRGNGPGNAIAIQTLAFGAALTNTWTGVRIAGVNVADFLLGAAVFFILLAAALNGRRLPIYTWAVLPPVALLAIALVGSVVRGDSLSSTQVAFQWTVGNAAGATYGGALPLIGRMALSLTAVTIIVAGMSDNATSRNITIKRIMGTWAAGAAVSGAYGIIAFSPIGKSVGLENVPFLFHYTSQARAIGLFPVNESNQF